MSSDNGFIKLDRGIVDHWVFKDDDALRLWIYLIILAQFENKEKPIPVGSGEKYLKRGEFIISMQRASIDLKINLRRVRRLLDKFKKTDMIVKTVGKGKDIPYVAKIVNYDKWQGHYDFKPKAIKRLSNGYQEAFKSQHTIMVNNGNNVNKSDIIFYCYQCPNCESVLANKTPIPDLSVSCNVCQQEGIKYALND